MTVLLLAHLLACAPAPSPDTGDVPDGCPDAPSLTLGTGGSAYAPLAEGDPVVFNAGFQGGWHVWVAGRVTGVEAEWLSVLPRLETADGVVLAGVQEPQLLTPTRDGCDAAFFGVYAYLDDAPMSGPEVCALAGQPLTLSAVVIDGTTGRSATAALGVTAALDPYGWTDCALYE